MYNQHTKETSTIYSIYELILTDMFVNCNKKDLEVYSLYVLKAVHKGFFIYITVVLRADSLQL